MQKTQQFYSSDPFDLRARLNIQTILVCMLPHNIQYYQRGASVIPETAASMYVQCQYTHLEHCTTYYF